MIGICLATALLFIALTPKCDEGELVTLRVQETTTTSTTLLTVSTTMTAKVTTLPMPTVSVLDHECYNSSGEHFDLELICPNMIGDGFCDDICNHPDQVVHIFANAAT